VFVLPGRDEPVPCCVVDFLDLDRCQVVDGFVWPLVVEPVDTVHRLEFDGSFRVFVVVLARGDRAAVLAQHRADRLDAEALAIGVHEVD
jgi:hypothetical protein